MATKTTKKKAITNTAAHVKITTPKEIVIEFPLRAGEQYGGGIRQKKGTVKKLANGILEFNVDCQKIKIPQKSLEAARNFGDGYSIVDSEGNKINNDTIQLPVNPVITGNTGNYNDKTNIGFSNEKQDLVLWYSSGYEGATSYSNASYKAKIKHTVVDKILEELNKKYEIVVKG